MVSEIRIYAEGGGDGRETKAGLREGLSEFLSSLRTMARERSIRWSVISCGSRNNAFRNFKIALRQHGHAFNVLLVDSESPVKDVPWAHLRSRDGWARPEASEDQCQLMVETMEAWLIADPDALERFYGQHFERHMIPKTQNVEALAKNRVARSLKLATRKTAKGEYHKTRHAPLLLKALDTEKVRRRAGHCERLFRTLEHLMP